MPRRLVADLQVPAQWSARSRGFYVRAERVPDLVAMLEYNNVAVSFHASEPKR